MIQKGDNRIYLGRDLLKWSFVGMLLLQFSLSNAQYQYDTYTHYTIEDGFQSMINYDVVQDSRGYIWLSTDAGISRFNGNEFKNFGLNEGLEQNEVVKMVPDSEGRIWLNSSGRVTFIQNDTIHTLDLLKSKDLHWNFNAISEGPNLWLIAKGHVNYLDNDLKEIDSEFTSQWKNKNKSHLIVGSFDESTILLYDGFIEIREKGVLKRKIKLEGAYVKDQIQKHQFFLDGGNLFYSGKFGLTKLNLSTSQTTVLSTKYKSLRKIHKAGNKLWIAKMTNGMSCLTLEDEQIVKTEDFLTDKLCSNFMFDDQQNLWVPTYGTGLFFFPKQYEGIENYSKDSDKIYSDLQTILVDNEDIWIGKLDGGLLKISNGRKKYYNYESYRGTAVNRILKIQKLDENTLVMASDDGLLLFENGKITVKHGMSTKNVQVGNDSLIVNNYAYTYKTSIKDFKTEEKTLSTSDMRLNPAVNKILDGRAYSSILDSKNRIWIANTENGLIELRNDGNKINHTEKNNLLNVSIVDIVELENEFICLSTNGEGIIMLNDKEFRQIDIEDGLSSDICFDIRAVGNTLYVATNKGVNIIEFEDDFHGRFKINVLDRMNGLLSNDARSIDYNDGKLYVATSDGFSIIKLDELKAEQHLAPIQIENIEVNQKKIAISDEIKLEHNQNSIKIDFSAISFIRNDQNVYAYKLENVNDDWIYTTTNEIQYSHLKPGDYAFKVRNANSTNPDSTQKVLFKIEPHFSQTILFKLLVGFALFGLFTSTFMNFIIRGQKRELKKLVNKRTTELQEKVSDLAHTNNKLEESNQELERFAYVTSHDLKSPLRSVGSFIELLTRKNEAKFDDKDREYLHYILTSVNKMNQVIKDLLTLSRIGNSEHKSELVNSKEILEQVIANNNFLIIEKNTQITTNGNFPILNIHPTELSSLFQNLITNAIKYNNSSKPIIEIRVKKSKSDWVFAIADNGIGINPKFGNKIFDLFQRLHTDKEYSGTGIGLSICKKIIDRQGGKIWFESELNQGSVFYFSLPHSLSKLPSTEKTMNLHYN